MWSNNFQILLVSLLSQYLLKPIWILRVQKIPYFWQADHTNQNDPAHMASLMEHLRILPFLTYLLDICGILFCILSLNILPPFMQNHLGLCLEPFPHYVLKLMELIIYTTGMFTIIELRLNWLMAQPVTQQGQISTLSFSSSYTGLNLSISIFWIQVQSNWSLL